MWHKENGVLRKSQPKLFPIEWRVVADLEMTTPILWFLTIKGPIKNYGRKRKPKNHYIMNLIICLYLLHTKNNQQIKNKNQKEKTAVV